MDTSTATHPDSQTTPAVKRVRRNLKSRRTRATVAALTVGGGLAALLATAAPASAAFATNSTIAGGTSLRSSPYTWGGNLGWLSNGTRVGMMCYVDSMVVNPPASRYSSVRWFKVGTYALGGSIGYVHSSFVVNQTGVGRC